MAGTGRGSLRPYQPSKGHNFLVIGLLLVVMVLSYNYWVVSVSKNEKTYQIVALETSMHKLDGSLKVGVMRWLLFSVLATTDILDRYKDILSV